MYRVSWDGGEVIGHIESIDRKVEDEIYSMFVPDKRFVVRQEWTIVVRAINGAQVIVDTRFVSDVRIEEL